MSTYWPTEDGWPYADVEQEEADLGAEYDDDLLSLRAGPPHLFDDLDPLERQVIESRFGLGGAPVRSMKQLQHDTGMARADLREALGSGLGKLRSHLI
jgi:DNA-directed RNA polymerase sigma subunit (sigma70/sigma32)